MKKKNFCIFFQSTHQVGMKNVVKCYKDVFGYFNALKTHGVMYQIMSASFIYNDLFARCFEGKPVKVGIQYLHLFPALHCGHFGSWKKLRHAKNALVGLHSTNDSTNEEFPHLHIYWPESA